MKTKYDIRFIDIMFIQLSIILIFSWIYYSMVDHFESTIEDNKLGYIDSLFFSTSIQSGVGIANMHAQSTTGKCIVIFQQILLIMSATYILFTFTLTP